MSDGLEALLVVLTALLLVAPIFFVKEEDWETIDEDTVGDGWQRRRKTND